MPCARMTSPKCRPSSAKSSPPRGHATPTTASCITIGPPITSCYAGLWKMSDEAHITTVGVRANQQGKGYGHALMAALIQRAYHLGSRWLTLEVRPSNDVAVRLYEKFGFKVIGRRRGYYTDNNED